MLNSKKSSNSKRLSADQAFYYIHVTLYYINWGTLNGVIDIKSSARY